MLTTKTLLTMECPLKENEDYSSLP